jgi:hypothetical protein
MIEDTKGVARRRQSKEKIEDTKGVTRRRNSIRND